MKADRAVLTTRQEELRHPPNVWIDPAYAQEPLERLHPEYMEYLTGRSQPACTETLVKYDTSILAFLRSLERQHMPLLLEPVTPQAVNNWLREQRAAGRTEDGIASRLGAVKVFTNKYVYKHLELTTRDLLVNVPRIIPPDKPAEVLTEREIEQVRGCFDRPTSEDVRNRAGVGTVQEMLGTPPT